MALKYSTPNGHNSSKDAIEDAVIKSTEQNVELSPSEYQKKIKGPYKRLIPPGAKKRLHKFGDYTDLEVESILRESNLSNDEAPKMYPDEPRGMRVRATMDGADFRRRQVNRLLIRGVPRQMIANHLGVALETINADAKAITVELRKELQELDYTVYIGQAVSFFDECRSIALRVATNDREKNGVKMVALRTALDAEKAKHDFFSKVGLFKMVSPTDPFHAINTGRQGSYSDENDLNSFMQLIAKAATGEVELGQFPPHNTQQETIPDSSHTPSPSITPEDDSPK